MQSASEAKGKTTKTLGILARDAHRQILDFIFCLLFNLKASISKVRKIYNWAKGRWAITSKITEGNE